MTAVDTNVLVRLLTGDHPKQASAAKPLFAAEPIWVAKTIAAALSLAAQGIDFADALHLSSRPPGSNFVSFDRAFVRRAKRTGAVGVAEIPI